MSRGWDYTGQLDCPKSPVSAGAQSCPFGLHKVAGWVRYPCQQAEASSRCQPTPRKARPLCWGNLEGKSYKKLFSEAWESPLARGCVSLLCLSSLLETPPRHLLFSCSRKFQPGCFIQSQLPSIGAIQGSAPNIPPRQGWRRLGAWQEELPSFVRDRVQVARSLRAPTGSSPPGEGGGREAPFPHRFPPPTAPLGILRDSPPSSLAGREPLARFPPLRRGLGRPASDPVRGAAVGRSLASFPRRRGGRPPCTGAESSRGSLSLPAEEPRSRQGGGERVRRCQTAAPLPVPPRACLKPRGLL